MQTVISYVRRPRGPTKSKSHYFSNLFRPQGFTKGAHGQLFKGAARRAPHNQKVVILQFARRP